MSALYLVQVRQRGEAWRTVASMLFVENAMEVAGFRASERHIYGDGITGPIYPYVRVALRGATIYDPRALKASTITATVAV